MDIVPPLLLQILFIALNAVFAAAEFAFISVGETKANKLASEGSHRAKLLYKLITNQSKLLATIQITITLSGFLSSAFAADTFSDMIINALLKNGVISATNAGYWNTVSVITITLILAFFALVFGELVPKRLAKKKPEKIAMSMSPVLNILSKMFTPLVWLLTASTNGVLRMLGVDPNAPDDEVREEDIQLMVDTSDDIHEEEKQMIQNVFEFNDIQVHEFATHRTDVKILWEDDDIDIWDKIIKDSFHKYYPVCKDTVDNIIGILNTKEYFKNGDLTHEQVLEFCLHAPYFVPETIKADLLFRQMKLSNHEFAVVLDEHGGVDGIVTFSDILEQIVGNFNLDEPANEPDIVQIEENAWRVLGCTSITSINEEFGTAFSEEDYETFSGLVFGIHGQIPADNTVFDIDIENLHIEIKQIKERKIEEAIVSLCLAPEIA